MPLVSLPPRQTRADLNLEHYLNTLLSETPRLSLRRTLPAEWEVQSGVQLTWPHAGTDWAYMLPEVTETYVRMAFEISTRQTLLIVAPEPEEVQRLLCERLPRRATEHIIYKACPTNDTWARDHAFLTVTGTDGIELLDFRFNGWGGKFEAALDNAINRNLMEQGALNGKYVSCLDFELEGGSVESDGQGTLLTTAKCLINPNRNGLLDQAQVETTLCQRLGMKRVLWLHHGALAGDDTDSHIDTLARFCPDNTIVYVRCLDKTDEHYAELAEMERELKALTTLDGEPYRLVPVPLPRAIYDEDGLRLPATYANFLIMNTAVLYPTYAQSDLDTEAEQALRKAFPKMDIVGIDCRSLIRQHGSLHCATMQYPRGVLPQAAEEAE